MRVTRIVRTTFIVAVALMSLLASAAGLNAAVYSTAVLADSPVAYWRLGEASSGNTAINLGTLGAAANGTYTAGASVGVASLIRSESGNTAFNVLGSERMVTANVEKFAGGTGYTAEYWIKLNATPGACCYSALSDGESNGDFFMMNYILGPNQGTPGAVRPHFGTTGNTVSINSASPLVAGEAAHVVTTWDQTSGVAAIYMNGKLINSQIVGTNGPGAATSTNPFFVGRDGRGGIDGSNMVVDDPAFYNKALTLDQVRTHYSKGRQLDSISLSTVVMIGDTPLTGPGQLGDGFSNNSGKSTIELVRFIANSNNAPLNIAYTQNPGDTIDFSPFVVSGATAGNLGADIHGRGSPLFAPGDGETSANNNGGIGFGGHANKLITFDLEDIDFEHFGTRDLALKLTGRFGINGQGGPGEVVNSSGQVQGLIFLDGILIDASPIQDIFDPSHAFELILPKSGRFLTFAIVNGDGSSSFDDGAFRDVTLSVFIIPEPMTGSLLGLACLALMRRRRTA